MSFETYWTMLAVAGCLILAFRVNRLTDRVEKLESRHD